MKLKKITENGNYNVVMSRLEINAVNELLGYVNVWNTKHELAQSTYKGLLEFFYEHATMELEDVFHPILDVDGQTFLLEKPVELHLKKDLLNV